MADNEIKLLLEYTDLLETELKESNPERFQQLIQKRESLIPLLQKQRALIDTLRIVHQDDLIRIDKLQAELFARGSEREARKAPPRSRPNAGRK